MELGLSLGESPTTRPFSFLDNKKEDQLGFRIALGRSFGSDQEHKRKHIDHDRYHDHDDDNNDDVDYDGDEDDHVKRPIPTKRVDISSPDLHVPLQLDLLPSAPVPRSHMASSPQFRFPWLSHTYGATKGAEGNRQPGGTVAAVTGEEVAEEAVTISSPNSTLSSFHMDFCVRANNTITTGLSMNNNNNNNNNSNMIELETERTSSRASDDDDNGSTRKKLRLSKDQSAFLEESFKEHSTLNPKQKLALAKQLNLRPRQVEVWFQNRRARTKLKQTEVDCEYLKRCCETLTEENRRLQKELQELRALKTSQPFYMQLPATTLTMCPSCERVATSNSAAVPGNSPAAAKPNLVHPFSQSQPGKA